MPDDFSDRPIRIPVTDVFDLHSVPSRDLKPMVEEYLLESNRLGFKALRIIHGRGIGARRAIVHAILAKNSIRRRLRGRSPRGRRLGGDGGDVALNHLPESLLFPPSREIINCLHQYTLANRRHR